MKGFKENDPETYRRSKQGLCQRPDPSHSFTFLASHRWLLRGPGQLGSGKIRGLTIHSENPLKGLVAVTAQAVLTTAGGLKMALGGDHHLPDGMLDTTNLDGSAKTLVDHLRIVVSRAESRDGSLQKLGFINS
jgi:hypothetical protein